MSCNKKSKLVEKLGLSKYFDNSGYIHVDKIGDFLFESSQIVKKLKKKGFDFTDIDTEKLFHIKEVPIGKGKLFLEYYEIEPTEYYKRLQVMQLDNIQASMRKDKKNEEALSKENVIGRIKEIRKRITANIIKLKVKKDKTKDDFNNIITLNSALKKLDVELSELKTLKSNTSTLNILGNIVNNLEDLVKKTNLDNIDTIESYIDFLEQLLDEGNPNSIYYSDILSLEYDLAIQNNTFSSRKRLLENLPGGKRTISELEGIRNRLSILKNKELKDIKTELARKAIKEQLKADNPKLKEEQAKEQAFKIFNKEFSNGVEDVGQITLFSRTLDNEKYGRAGKIITKILHDAQAKRVTDYEIDSLRRLKPALEKELKKLGYTKSILGLPFGLGGEVDYSIFLESPMIIPETGDKWYTDEVAIISPIVSRYFNNIEKYKERFINLVKKDFNKATEFLHAELKNNDTINLLKIPEILLDKSINTDKFDTVSIEEAKKYKKELIDRLGRVHYENLIHQAKEKIFRVEALLSNVEAKHKEEETFSPEVLRKLELKRKIMHPLYISANIEKIKEKESYADMRSIFFIPKSGDKLWENKNFKKIKDNPILFKAWNHISYLNNFIVKNGADKLSNTNSLVNSIDEVASYVAENKNYLYMLSHKLLTWISNLLGVKEKDIDKVRKISKSASTVEDEVNRRMPIYIAKIISKYGKKPTKTQINSLRQQLRKRVLSEQKLNLLETLANKAELVEKIRARVETESRIVFLAKMLKDVKDKKGNNREFFNKAIDTFLDLDFYMKRPARAWKSSNYKLKSGRNKLETKKIKKIEKELKELLDKGGIDKEVYEYAIKELQRHYDSLGKKLAVGAAIDTFLKFTVYKALAWNFSSQTKNKTMGHIDGASLDGIVYSRGNLQKAYKKISKKDVHLMNTLFYSLRIYQNAANELLTMGNFKTSGKIKEVLTKPMGNISFTEKSIQSPQIAAMLGDVYISLKDTPENITKFLEENPTAKYDKETNKVSFPVYDLNDLKNPFKAFEIDKDGEISLKKEFASEENINTWIKHTSQEFANLFGMGGKIPVGIALINGNYREDSSYYMQRLVLGKVGLLLKKWMPNVLTKLYDITTDLMESDDKKNLRALLLGLSVTSYLTAGGSLAAMFAPSIPMYIFMKTYWNDAKNRMNTEEEQTIQIIETAKIAKSAANELRKTILSILLRSGRLTGTAILQGSENLATTALGVGKKVTKTGNIFGNQIVADETYDKLKGFKEVATEEEMLKLNYLYKHMMYAYEMLMMMILASILLGPPSGDDDDDDEELKKWKEYNKKFKDTSFWNRIIKYPKQTVYYTLSNYYDNILDDVHLGINLAPTVAVLSSLFNSTRLADNGLKILGIADPNSWKTVKAKGKHKGKSAGMVAIEEGLIPNGLKEYSGGFSNVSRKEYNVSSKIDELLNKENPAIQKITTTIEILRDRKWEEYKEKEKISVEEEEEERKYWIKDKTVSKKWFKNNKIDPEYEDDVLDLIIELGYDYKFALKFIKEHSKNK